MTDCIPQLVQQQQRSPTRIANSRPRPYHQASCLLWAAPKRRREPGPHFPHPHRLAQLKRAEITPSGLADLTSLEWLCVYGEKDSAYLLPKHVRQLARLPRLKHLDAPILEPYRITSLRFSIDDDDDEEEEEVNGEDDIDAAKEEFEKMPDAAVFPSLKSLVVDAPFFDVLVGRTFTALESMTFIAEEDNWLDCYGSMPTVPRAPKLTQFEVAISASRDDVWRPRNVEGTVTIPVSVSDGKIRANAPSLSTIHYRVPKKQERKMRKNPMPVYAL
ncbi:hypothetical protein GGF32_000869 [Allomyces javanicus]|nr:hypothetical protein GGF32_000869 [Allomyces javanicus]